MTTVVYPELAKSYMLHAQTSRNRTPPDSALPMEHSNFRYSLELMQQVAKTGSGSGIDHQLSLPEVLAWLVEDKLVAAEAAEQLKKERRYYRGTLHPLVVVSDQKWK